MAGGDCMILHRNRGYEVNNLYPRKKPQGLIARFCGTLREYLEAIRQAARRFQR
jgi:hypothetical protein